MTLTVGEVTTGLLPLVVGGRKTFVHQATIGGLPWDLAGGSAVLKLRDPAGTTTTVAATITAGVARATWVVTAPVGTWTRCWDSTDADGVRQVSRPIAFEVIDSP